MTHRSTTICRAALADVIRTLPYSTGAAILWIVIAYFFHQSIIDAVTGGRDVTRQEQPRLYNLLENLCISRGIPMPKLKVMDSDALNAFATGLNRRQYAVTVTTGLLNTLDDQEMEAVLGHELTHIRNGDVQMMVIAVIIAGAVGFFAELLFRGFGNFGGYGWGWGGGSYRSSSSSSSSSDSGSSDRKGGGGAAILVIVLAVVLIIVAWALSQLVKLALSRSREFLADAGSVELTKNPDAMISALRKIEGRGELPDATSAVMELCVDNPREGFADIFATHPSVEARVDALVKYAGGHYEGPLALPMHPAQPDGPPDQPEGGQLPPPAGSVERWPVHPAQPAERDTACASTGSLGQSDRAVGPALSTAFGLSSPPPERGRSAAAGCREGVAFEPPSPNLTPSLTLPLSGGGNSFGALGD